MAGDLIIDKVAASSTATKTSLMRGLLKSWALADAAGTASASQNVASLTDSGTGVVLVNLTAAMGSVNYVSVGSADDQTLVPGVRFVMTGTRTTSRVDFKAQQLTPALVDPSYWHIVSTGDLA